MYIVRFKLLSMLFVITNGASHLTQEGQITNNLTQELLSSYNIFVIPDAPINISLLLGFYQLINLDERDQIMTINGYLQQTWMDYRLTWDPNNYGSIEYINIPSTMIWLPDTHLRNSGSDKVLFSNEVTPNLNAIVSYEGEVLLYLPMMNLESRCHINTRKFPFDKQVCPIIIESWSFTNYYIKYDRTFPEFLKDSFTENPIWLFKGATVKVNTTSYGHSLVCYLLEFDRKPLYYMVNGIFPCFILNIVSVIAFLMDYEMQVNLSLTCFLTLTVNSVVVLEGIPEQSDYLPLITVYFMVSIMLPFISLFWFMYHESLSKREKLPKWIEIAYNLKNSIIKKLPNKVTKVQAFETDQQEEVQFKIKLNFINNITGLLFFICVLVSDLAIWLSFLD